MDRHGMGEQIAQQWQHLKASLQTAWEKLTQDEGPPGGPRHPSHIQKDYLRRREQEDRAKAETETGKKDAFQKMSEVNGNLKLNQYVQNPAPGPSERHGPQGENDIRDKAAEDDKSKH